MEQPQRKQNPLETEPIGRLIRRYSIPTALTLMVNYLYNIDGSDLCRPGGGGHGDGRHQRGLSSDHCHHCPGADDRGRLRGEYEPLPGPPAARGGGPGPPAIP